MSAKHIRRSAPPSERIAVVTGASSGIGRAVAVALARTGYTLCAIGRNRSRLTKTVADAQSFSRAIAFPLDLTSDGSLPPLVNFLAREAGRVDILFHGAGIIHQDLLQRASIHHFDQQYGINVRAPYVLTQQLLPLLVKARGQVVFANSSAGLVVNRPEIAQYAATKHALKAIADSLRAEVNSKGVRVLSVYLGRTATPMQKALFKLEARAYRTGELLRPKDVATIVLAALALPRTAEVTDISIRPMAKGKA